MNIIVTQKNNGYEVMDKEHSRKLYTVKKKGFITSSYHLVDPSNYELYSFSQNKFESKPSFVISNNGKGLIKMICDSFFLDPTITVTGSDTSGAPVNYVLSSKDRRNFEITKDNVHCGSIQTLTTVSNAIQYELEFENKFFDDFIVFFAVAVDFAFGKLNNPK